MEVYSTIKPGVGVTKDSLEKVTFKNKKITCMPVPWASPCTQLVISTSHTFSLFFFTTPKSALNFLVIPIWGILLATKQCPYHSTEMSTRICISTKLFPRLLLIWQLKSTYFPNQALRYFNLRSVFLKLIIGFLYHIRN